MTKKDWFETLFTQKYHQLYVHAFGYVEDDECAKDIVQDAFVYLWEHLDQYEADAFLPLLYRLVRNLSIDNLRHLQAAEHYVRYIMDTPVPEGLDYEDYDKKLAAIKRSIDSLPPQTRRIFVECVFHKRSYKDAAQLFGISPLTVKTFMARAFKMIRKQNEIFIPFFVLLIPTLYAL